MRIKYLKEWVAQQEKRSEKRVAQQQKFSEKRVAQQEKFYCNYLNQYKIYFRILVRVCVRAQYLITN